MPPKTIAEVAEMVTDLRRDHDVLKSKVGDVQDDIRTAELYHLRERLAVIEALLAELTKKVEEADRRRWQFWLGAGVVVLTFAANLTINLLVLFARK